MTKSKPVERDFNVFVGAETGILKGVSINPKANLAKNFHNLKALQKSDEITALNWNNEEKTELLLGLRNQTVKIFDLNDKMFIQSLDCSSEEDGSHGPIVGVCRASDSVLVTATRSGVVRVWKASDNPVLIKPIDYELECSGKLKRNQFEKEEEREKHLATLKAGRELVVMKHSRMSPNLIATGGKENDLQIWDLENLDKPTFRAKNVRPDFLELRVPVWITGIAYPDPTSHHLLSTSSRHGHIRLYDLRISGQRRPVRELEWPEAAITSMSATNDPNQVLVGTNVGELALFDFRKEHKGMKGMVRKYKGCVGSVRNIDAMEDKPYFATVGLDRFLRIYDIKSRRPLQKVYLKSRLNSVLLRPDFDPFQTEKERQEEAERLAREAEMDSDIEEIADVEEERDSLWKNMEEVGEGVAATAEKKKKRKAALEDEEDATAEEEHIEKPKKKRGKKKLKKVKG